MADRLDTMASNGRYHHWKRPNCSRPDWRKPAWTKEAIAEWLGDCGKDRFVGDDGNPSRPLGSIAPAVVACNSDGGSRFVVDSHSHCSKIQQQSKSRPLFHNDSVDDRPSWFKSFEFSKHCVATVWKKNKFFFECVRPGTPSLSDLLGTMSVFYIPFLPLFFFWKWQFSFLSFFFFRLGFVFSFPKSTTTVSRGLWVLVLGRGMYAKQLNRSKSSYLYLDPIGALNEWGTPPCRISVFSKGSLVLLCLHTPTSDSDVGDSFCSFCLKMMSNFK